MGQPKKCIVLGLDGGTLDLILPWARDGLLPAFKEVIQNGAYGPLMSTLPPSTGPGWPSSVTGVNPGGHGFYDFWKVHTPGHQLSFNHAKDIPVPSIWDILSAQGRSVGVINVPMTHPPHPVEGFMISWPLHQTLKYCYPKNLNAELIESGKSFPPDIMQMFDGDLEGYPQQCLDLMEKRREASLYLYEKEKPDFFMTTFTSIDRVSHFYWKYMDPTHDEFVRESLFKDVILNCYKKMDSILADFLNLLDDQTDLFLYSDHGFGRCEGNFCLNYVLRELGFLHLDFPVVDEATHPTVDWLNSNQLRCARVNLEKSQAFLATPDSFGINVCVPGRDDSGEVVKTPEYEKIREQVIDAVRDLKNPITGLPLLKGIWKREDVYSGECLGQAPDLVFMPYDLAYWPSNLLDPDSLMIRAKESGQHRNEGVVMAYGQSIENKIIDVAKLEDICPTILACMNTDAPSHVEGKVIDCFREEKKLENLKNINFSKEGVYGYSGDENAEIAKNLKRLGYF